MIEMTTEYDELIQSACDEFLPDLDWRLYKAQLWQESRLDPNAVSPVGAQGLAQVMPATWDMVSPWVSEFPLDPFKPKDSILVGACYMDYLLKQWSWPRPGVDRHSLAMASYNAGLGNILKAQERTFEDGESKTLYGEIIPELINVTGEKNSAETIGYVQNIWGYYMIMVLGV